jgi:hypothetical protein
LATYHAIAATSRAIIGLLEQAFPTSELDGADFEVYQASNFQKPMLEGVSLYLYRIGAGGRRNLASRVGPKGQRHRPPLPLDLYYLLTTWGRTAEKQQLLLGWCVRELQNTPILPPSLLNHYAAARDTFRPDEPVELVFDPISLQDTANLWEPLKPNLQVSATYVARMIAVESTIEVAQAEDVQTREFDFAKATD